MHAVVDIGGTKTRIGLTEDKQKFTRIEKYLTPKNLETIQEKLHNVLGPSLEHLVLGVAATIDSDNGQILKSSNIPVLDGKTVSDIYIGETEKNLLKNDAELAGFAEANAPQADGYERVAYITISTGVGGTLIVDEKVPNARYNYEPGHTFGENTTWEERSSGSAFEKKFGISPKECTDAEIWAQYGKDLAAGLNDMILLWRPDLVVLGGSMAKKADLFLPSAKQALSEYEFAGDVDIKVFELDENVLEGGLLLLKSL